MKTRVELRLEEIKEKQKEKALRMTALENFICPDCGGNMVKIYSSFFSNKSVYQCDECRYWHEYYTDVSY